MIVFTNWLALIYQNIGCLPMAVWLMSCCWGFAWDIRQHGSSKRVVSVICPQKDGRLLYSHGAREIDHTTNSCKD